MFPPRFTAVNENLPSWWNTYIFGTLTNCVSAGRRDLLDQCAMLLGASDILFLPPDERYLSGLGILSDGNEAVVSFQGTRNGWQALAEILFTPQTTSTGVPGQVHGFFGAVFQRNLSRMSAVIDTLPIGFPVLFSGHSLGGAVAEIAGKYFGQPQRVKSRGIVTFGSPRAGNGRFSAFYAAPMLRVGVQDDLVPTLPPPAWLSLAMLGPLAATLYGFNYVHTANGWIVMNDGTLQRGNTTLIDTWGPPNPFPALRLVPALEACLEAHSIKNYCTRVLNLALPDNPPISLAPFIRINEQLG